MDNELQAEVAAGVEPPAELTEQTAPAAETLPVVEDAAASTDSSTSNDVAKSEDLSADHTITIKVDTSEAQAQIAALLAQLPEPPPDPEHILLAEPSSLEVRSALTIPHDAPVVVVGIDGREWHFTTGEEVHAFVDDLLAAARKSFGASHSGLYVEKVG